MELFYHFVCLDKVTYSLLHEILGSTSVDPYHLKVPHRWGKKILTLRLSEKNGKKPTLIKEIPSPYNGNNVKSRIHAILLNSIYDLNIPMDNVDNGTVLIGAKYRI